MQYFTFIKKANLKFNNVYKYKNYNNNSVDILCNIHGLFTQNPRRHLQGKGCPLCVQELNVENKKNNFIKKAILLYGEKYNYSELNYISNTQPVNIICETHGVFSMLPISHLRGYGCPKCNIDRKQIFLEKAKHIHQNKYDYSQVNYIDSRTHIKVICYSHGVFEITPKRHLKGYGCKKCNNKSMKTTDVFVEESTAIFGNTYNYSEVIYKGAFQRVNIICPTHGVFQQSPHDHLKGSGCPKCNTSKGELYIETLLKKYNIDYIRQKTFETLKNQRPLRYDFYIPSKNILIEYNGKQHYMFIPYWHKTEQGFHLQKHRDWLKRKYALNNGYMLVTIGYWENIKEKIKSTLLQEKSALI